MSLITSASVNDERDHAAITTNNEFAALAIKVQSDAALDELMRLPHFLSLSRRQASDLDVIEDFLVNGWNTERILGITADSLTPGALPSGLQWAFPMAYYSVYSVTRACFKTAGYTEASHTSVIRKFGSLVQQGKYPESVSFFASGPRPCRFSGVQQEAGFSTLITPYDKQTADKIIACFLNATRKRDLQEKKKHIKLPTKAGKRKRAFRSGDWSQVSEGLGHTSLLSLLYRKRIKANYQDIDTFLSPKINGTGIFCSLQQIVNSLNLIHEAMIARMIGIDEFEKLEADLSSKDFQSLRKRFEKIRTALSETV